MIEQKTTNTLGYRYIRSDFDFTAIPTGYDNSIWEVKDSFDFESNPTINLPANIELDFNGGFIDNCILNCNNTFIKGSFQHSFGENVIFYGTPKFDFLSLEMFGGKADDVTNNSLQIKRCLQIIKSSGNETKKIRCQAGTYVFDEKTRVFNTAVEFIGDNTTFRRGTTAGVIEIRNDGIMYDITGEIVTETTHTTINGVADADINFKIGDVVKIASDDDITTLRPSTPIQRAEYGVVRRVTSTTLEISGYLRYIYATNPKVMKQNENQVIIKGIRLTDNFLTPTNYFDYFLRIVGGMYHIIDDVTVINSKVTAISMVGCYGYEVTRFRTKYAVNKSDAVDIDDYNNGRIGYGIVDVAGGYFKVSLIGHYVRHSFTTGGWFSASGSADWRGVSEYGTIYNSSGSGGSNSILDVHEHSYAIKITGGIVTKCHGWAVQLRGDRNTLENVDIVDTKSGLQIFNYEGTSNNGNNLIKNCRFRTYERPFSINTDGHRLIGNIFKDNVFDAIVSPITITDSDVKFVNCEFNNITARNIINVLSGTVNILFNRCTFNFNQTIAGDVSLLLVNSGCNFTIRFIDCKANNDLGTETVDFKLVEFVGTPLTTELIFADGLTVLPNSNLTLTGATPSEKWTNKTSLTDISIFPTGGSLT